MCNRFHTPNSDRPLVSRNCRKVCLGAMLLNCTKVINIQVRLQILTRYAFCPVSRLFCTLLFKKYISVQYHTHRISPKGSKITFAEKLYSLQNQILIGIPVGEKRPVGSRRWLEDNIKAVLKKCGVRVWFGFICPRVWTIGHEPLGPIKLGNLLSIWATVPLRKIWRKLWFCIHVVQFIRKTVRKNATAITELKRCFGFIRQQTSRFLWRIFFVEIVTPIKGVKRKDCHKRWAYVRPPQAPRRRWHRPDIQNAKISCGVFRTWFLSSDGRQYSGSLLWDPRESG
jgi:hypothetical protein